MKLYIASSILFTTVYSNLAEILTSAKDLVNSAAFESKFDSNYVDLQKAWVSQAEYQNAARGFLPESVIAGLEELISEGNRVNQLHCENGNCTVTMGLDKIWDYGCWCNFGENLMTGRYQAQNLFDGICKDFQRCLRCAKKDNGNCDPVTKVYNANSGPDFITACTGGNPDDQCASHTCMCEQTLIAEILNEAFEQSEPYSDMYLHSNGFDYETECPKAALADAGAEAGSECCGVYPKRFPMGANTEVSCCSDAVLFNPLVRDCCTDGSVMDAGSCPM